MQPRESDSPGQRGGELPGAGSNPATTTPASKAVTDPPVVSGGPSAVTQGTRGSTAPAPSRYRPPSHMQPGPSDGPGQRGGELPGAGSPPVYDGSTAKGPDFGKPIRWAGHEIKKLTYDKPWCVQAGAYDGWGGGGGACVDLKHQVVQPFVKGGVGVGGGVQVTRPPRDTIPKHRYVMAGAEGSGGMAGSVNGEVQLRDPGHGFPVSDEGGFDFPWLLKGKRWSVGSDGSASRDSGPKHAGASGPGSDTGGKHRGYPGLKDAPRVLSGMTPTKENYSVDGYVGLSGTFHYGDRKKFLRDLREWKLIPLPDPPPFSF